MEDKLGGGYDGDEVTLFKAQVVVLLIVLQAAAFTLRKSSNMVSCSDDLELAKSVLRLKNEANKLAELGCHENE